MATPQSDAGGRVLRARPPEAEVVFSRLKHEISIGQIAYGARLVEAQLAERYGVSRTPIRQALLALEQSGLLARDGRSLRVRAPTPTEIMEIYEMRELLEERGVRLAVSRHDESDAFVLNRLVERMSGDVSNTERYAMNREFHTAIWRAAHHTVLLQTLERLYATSVLGLSTTLTGQERWKKSLAEHGALLKAILSGDEDGAADLMRQHLRTARDIRLQASLDRTWNL